MKIDLINKVYLYVPDDGCYKEKNQYVMQVIAPQPQGRVGGSDTHVLQLAIEQKKNSSFLPVVLFKRNKDYERRLFENGIAYICGIYADDDEIASALGTIYSYINIVLIHSHQYDANFLTQTIKTKCNPFKNVPTVMTCHGWIENTEEDIKETIRDFESYYFADALITVCKKDLIRLENDSRCRGKKLICINNGVRIPDKRDDSIAIQEFKVKYGLTESNNILAFVGRLAYEKRIDLIIDTFKLVTLKNDCKMLIVGSGDEYENLRQKVVDECLDDRVIFTGFLENPNIVYLVTDLLLLMSDTEGTPRCVLESMSLGKMAVTTDVGGIREIIDDGVDGIVLKHNNPYLAAAIISDLLANKKKRNRMNRQAREKIIDKFSIHNMQNQVEKVYLSILD